ncbi:ethionine resistance protein [Umbelopsis sp. WA50703]|jgi:MATE family multidrug resistance protein
MTQASSLEDGSLAYVNERTHLLSKSTTKLPEPNWTDEITWLIKKSLPVVAAYLLQSSLQSVTIISVGRLGAAELASATLGSILATVTGFSVMTGASLALDTLLSQAFTGADDVTVVGLQFQRSLIIMGLLMAPVSVLWWYAEKVFLLLGQDPIIAEKASVFVRLMIPTAPAFGIFEALKKYLQAQGIFSAGTYMLMIGAPLNLIFNYILVWSPMFSIGYIGGPLSTCLSSWIIVLLTVLYIRYINGSAAWGGWNRAALKVKDWIPFMKLAIPGILLICTETWAFEIITLAASWMGTTSLAAQSVIWTTQTTLYTLPFGIGVAAATRSGNLLGGGFSRQAKLAAHMALALAAGIAFFNCGLLLTLRATWGSFFTDDPAVVELVAKVLPFVAVFCIADTTAGISDGLLNGQGRQKIAATINIATYYLTALPIGFWLSFKMDLGLQGLWLSLAVAMFGACLTTVLLILRTNWTEQANAAYLRAKGE